MKTIAYLRVSTSTQDLAQQRLGLRVDDFIEMAIASRRSPKERGIEKLFTTLQPMDLLVVWKTRHAEQGHSGVVRALRRDRKGPHLRENQARFGDGPGEETDAQAPQGESLGKSRLEGKEDQIRLLLGKQVSKTPSPTF